MKNLFCYGTVMALAMTAMACSKGPEPTSSTLQVTGRVDTQLRTLDNASAIAIGSDGRTYSAYLQKNGSFRLNLPVGHVYRVLFANSTMSGQLRTIGHLVNKTSSGKADEIAVKDGGRLNLGSVRPAGATASTLKTACDCAATGGDGSDDKSADTSDDTSGDKSSGDKSADKSSGDKSSGDKSSGDKSSGDKSASDDSDYDTKDTGDSGLLCDDATDVELEAENGPGDACAKGDDAASAPKPAPKSCSTADGNKDGMDDAPDNSSAKGGSATDGSAKDGSAKGGSADDGAKDTGSKDPSASSDGSGASCKCSMQCGSGSSCVASKCAADAAGAADNGGGKPSK